MGGHASRGWLGIGVGNQNNKVIVSSIYDSTPAQKFGLRKGDIIHKIDGEKISNSEELIRTIGKYRSNDKIAILIERNGIKKTISVTLGERPLEEDLNSGQFMQEQLSQSSTLGIQVSEIAGFNTQNRNQKGL